MQSTVLKSTDQVLQRRSPQNRRILFGFHSKKTAWSSDDFGWLITLSDLTLLLLFSLVIWYVTDKQESVAKEPQATASLTSVESGEEAKVEAAEELIAAPAEERWQILEDEMEKYVGGIGFSEEINIISNQHELLIALKDTVPFASGKAELRQDFLPLLQKVAAIARSQPDIMLEILGHTDDVPISTPEFPSNWELSSARASRVARYLMKNGVDPTRFSIQGYGYFRPLLPNTSTENRGANRRAEIRLYKPSKRSFETMESSLSPPQRYIGLRKGASESDGPDPIMTGIY